MYVSLYPDVPQELIDVMNMIDFSRIPAHEIPGKLALLDAQAHKHLTLRATAATQYQRVVADGVPDALIGILNKYDYSQIGSFKRRLLKPVFMKWVSNNLPCKR